MSLKVFWPDKEQPLFCETLFHFWVEGNERETIDVTEILHEQDFRICVQKYIHQKYIHACDAINGSEKKKCNSK